ncbi:trypsin-like peptidase domain-containing protein [Gordonia terrae]
MSLDFFPRLATGAVSFLPPNGKWEFSGTGAMFMRPYVILTAAHCVPEVAGATFAFQSPMESAHAYVVERVIRHPTKDVAALIISRDAKAPPTGVYSEVRHQLVDGGDFIAFGYPAEADTSVPRLFKGHYQRHFLYEPPNGQSYFAVELSIPAPAGLSGGPVSDAHRPQVLDAIVTANHDSSLVIDSYEEEERDGTISRGKITRVVSYGIAAVLVGEDSWLDSVVRSADTDT